MKPVPRPVGLRMETIDEVTRAAICAGVSVAGAATAFGGAGIADAAAIGATGAGPGPQEIAARPRAEISHAERVRMARIVAAARRSSEGITARARVIEGTARKGAVSILCFDEDPCAVRR